MNKTIGILALQGNFSLHAKRIEELGAQSVEVRDCSLLESIDGIIIPGGESTTLLKLLDTKFRTTLTEKISKGFPVFATCAGLILLANKVINPEQTSLNLLDIEVERNSYGRQIDSFITKDLSWTKEGEEIKNNLNNNHETLEAVFIRAPKIKSIGKKVISFLTYNDTPVLVKQNNILACSFHPELSKEAYSIHELFLASL